MSLYFPTNDPASSKSEKVPYVAKAKGDSPPNPNAKKDSNGGAKKGILKVDKKKENVKKKKEPAADVKLPHDKCGRHHPGGDAACWVVHPELKTKIDSSSEKKVKFGTSSSASRMSDVQLARYLIDFVNGSDNEFSSSSSRFRTLEESDSLASLEIISRVRNSLQEVPAFFSAMNFVRKDSSPDAKNAVSSSDSGVPCSNLVSNV